MDKKNYNESIFDEYFQKKEKINYSNFTGKMSRRDKKIVKILTEYGIKNQFCLDVAPGTGRWLQYFKDNEAKYIAGIDISQKSIDNFSKICNKTQKADLEIDKFDFESNYFDIVISFMTLEHLRDPDLYLSEIIRVLKKNGLLIMSIPNIVSLISRVRVLLGIMPQAVTNDKTHIKFYTKKELIQLFKPFNQIPKMIPTSFSLNPFNNSSLRIPSSGLTKSLDDHLLFVVTMK